MNSLVRNRLGATVGLPGAVDLELAAEKFVGRPGLGVRQSRPHRGRRKDANFNSKCCTFGFRHDRPTRIPSGARPSLRLTTRRSTRLLDAHLKLPVPGARCRQLLTTTSAPTDCRSYAHGWPGAGHAHNRANQNGRPAPATPPSLFPASRPTPALQRYARPAVQGALGRPTPTD